METAAPVAALLDGRWRLGRVLGRGAAADVHLATDETTGRAVAVKVLRVADAEALTRFQREVIALEALDHPGIVAVLGHGTCPDGRPYLVLERADGGTLADALAEGPLGDERAAEVGAVLADALDHAHGRGVVHRDVKPANVLLDADGRAQLADFGIARLVGAAGLTATGWGLGTPAYLAPEQVRGEPVGAAADVYSLGLVVLEAATGVRAYPGEGLAAALARVERRPEVPGSIPTALASAITAMTASVPADRPSAADAARRLAATVDAGSTMAIPVAAIDTATLPVAPAPPPAPVVSPVAPADPVPEAARWRPTPAVRRAMVAAACFAIGFLAVLAAWAVAADDRGGGVDPAAELDVPADTTTTSAPPTTIPTTTAPPVVVEGDDDEERPGNGNGGGRDRERERERDD